MKNSGYKGMLRDRCPTTVDYALKWQKAKERWINHVYNHIIRYAWTEYDLQKNLKLSYNDCKNHLTRLILGIRKGKVVNFEFDYTIDWDNITQEEREYWKTVSSWVNWFRTQYLYIKNEYEISRKAGKNEFDAKVVIINTYLSSLLPKETDNEEEKQAKFAYVDKLANFLVDCFEKRILNKEDMFSVFSNKLIALRKSIETAKLRKPCEEEFGIEDTIKYLKKGQNIPYIIIPPNTTEDIADKLLYEYCINKDLRKIIQWIVDKILIECCNSAEYNQTRFVRMRIATNMLNKLVYEKKLDRKYNIYIHDGFVTNINLLVHDLMNEQLPFLNQTSRKYGFDSTGSTIRLVSVTSLMRLITT